MKQKLFYLLIVAMLTMGFAACSNDDDDDNLTPNIDLSTVTSDLTLQNGDVVTGKLNEDVKISIADGATVTFKGITIAGDINIEKPWPGITCKGKATIKLADGSTNIVNTYGKCYPGIYVPIGKMLAIRGNTGELRVRGVRAAAIGGGSTGLSDADAVVNEDYVDCGNISIEGGAITAISSMEAACIGAGINAKCGDITISGGTVIARAAFGPAIGSVSGGYCRRIVIKGGIIDASTSWNEAPAIGSSGWMGKGKFYEINITSGITSLTATGGDCITVPPIGKGKKDASSGYINIDNKLDPEASWNGDGMRNLKFSKPEGSTNTWKLERK